MQGPCWRVPLSPWPDDFTRQFPHADALCNARSLPIPHWESGCRLIVWLWFNSRDQQVCHHLLDARPPARRNSVCNVTKFYSAMNQQRTFTDNVTSKGCECKIVQAVHCTVPHTTGGLTSTKILFQLHGVKKETSATLVCNTTRLIWSSWSMEFVYKTTLRRICILHGADQLIWRLGCGLDNPIGTGAGPFFTPVSICALGPTQPPIQWYRGLFAGVKWPGPEAHYSPPSSSEVKNAWI
jgi:hypothetical protein